MAASRTGQSVIIGAVLLLMVAVPATAGTIIYVKADATGADNGTTWADAYRELVPALARAVSGDQIWVAAGTYRPSVRTVPDDPRSATFTLRGGVALYGGFAGNETTLAQRSFVAHHSILSGDLANNDQGSGDKSDNAYHVLCYLERFHDAAFLDGLTVTGGYADVKLNDRDHGAGVFVKNGPIVIHHCTFRGSFARRAGAGLAQYTASWFDASDCLFEDNEIDTEDASKCYGGAIESIGGTPVFTRCVFRRNSAKSYGGMYGSLGAAIAQYLGTLSLVDCLLEDNHAMGTGGAVFVGSDAGARITGCTFARNIGELTGGAVAAYGYADLTVKDCTFVENVSLGGGSDGGGAVFDENGVLKLTGCTFIRNQSNRGAAVRAQYTTVQAANCLLQDNIATDNGGAAYSRMSDVTMVNCVVSGSRALSGGAFSNSESTLTLTSCTIAHNTATAAFGVVDVFSGNATRSVAFRNCIVWENSGPGGATDEQQIDAVDGAVTVDHSCIGGWSGNLGGTGNIGLDPLLVAGDPWYRLQAASPCIDAGDSTFLPSDFADLDGDGNTSEPTPRDFENHPRRVDDPFVLDTGAGGAPVVDMGAHEYAEDCDANGLFDVCDLSCSAAGGVCNVPGCGTAGDCDGDAIPDRCEPDNEGDGLIDDCDPDDDNDGILDDGDASGTIGDHPCPNGQTSGCDDNCHTTANSDQSDPDMDGIGTACDACPNTIPGATVDSSGCPPLIPGDFDRDGDVDQLDFGRIQNCLSGPTTPQEAPECASSHLDGDSDVDRADMTIFLGCLSGPDLPADANCGE